MPKPLSTAEVKPFQQVNVTLPSKSIELLDKMTDGTARTRSSVVNRLIEQAASERGLAEATR